MKKPALSAIIAVLISFIVYQVMLLYGKDTALFAVTATAAFVAFVAFVAVATGAFTVTATAFTAAASIAATTTFDGFAAIILATFAVSTVGFAANKQHIPYRWMFALYGVAAITLFSVLLTPALAPCAIIAVAGCGAVGGIWLLYNRSLYSIPSPQPSP